MKVLNIFYIGICFILIFAGCSTENPTAPAVSQDNDAINTLAKKVVSYFEGTSLTVLPPEDPGKMINLPTGKTMIRGFVVKTLDDMDDMRVTGTVLWIVHMDIYMDGSDERWGSGELIIPDVGKWDMTYKGWADPMVGVRYEVDGHGKEGLKGKKAHWTYLKPPGQQHFDVQGYILE
jgi:hypothetical protein